MGSIHLSSPLLARQSVLRLAIITHQNTPLGARAPLEDLR
jgi:hypothetical protein